MELIYIISFITLILLIWLKSDAIIEWGSLFGLSKILKIEDYFDKRLEMVMRGISISYSYPEFLKEKYNYNFITKMLGCPLCLSVWLSILMCLIFSTFLSIPLVCISSLIAYGTITKLIRL